MIQASGSYPARTAVDCTIDPNVVSIHAASDIYTLAVAPGVKVRYTAEQAQELVNDLLLLLNGNASTEDLDTDLMRGIANLSDLARDHDQAQHEAQIEHESNREDF